MKKYIKPAMQIINFDSVQPLLVGSVDSVNNSYSSSVQLSRRRGNIWDDEEE